MLGVIYWRKLPPAALVIGGVHLADGVHAQRDDGTLLHMGPRVAGLSHAACDHRSRHSAVVNRITGTSRT